MKRLNEKRELLIENKIFTKNDVKSLIKIFIDLSNKILEKSKEIKRNDLIQEGWQGSNITEGNINTGHSGLEFTSSDNLKYTFTFEDISEVNEILDNKEISEIELYFSENVLDSRFIIRIRYSDSYSKSSYALVEGQDRNWVNGSFRFVEDFLDTCKNQSAFVNKYKIIIIALTIILLVLFLHNLIDFFIKTKVLFPKIVGNMFTKSLFYVIIILSLISATPAILVYKWMKKIFPVIEIQTGKEFQHADKEKSKKLLAIISLIIIPTVISFLLHLI